MPQVVSRFLSTLWHNTYCLWFVINAGSEALVWRLLTLLRCGVQGEEHVGKEGVQRSHAHDATRCDGAHHRGPHAYTAYQRPHREVTQPLRPGHHHCGHQGRGRHHVFFAAPQEGTFCSSAPPSSASLLLCMACDMVACERAHNSMSTEKHVNNKSFGYVGISFGEKEGIMPGG